MIDIIFYIFCLFRPISTTSLFVTTNIGMTLSEIVSLGTSYVFIVISIVRLNKVRIDFPSIIIFLFCSYLLLSGILGGGYREIIKLVLPFSVFFAIRTANISEEKLKHYFLLLVVGFSIPVFYSALRVLSGQGVESVIFQTGISRYLGAYTGPHAMAHSMFVCLLTLAIYRYFRSKEGKLSILTKLYIFLLALLSVFNLYKTYTRNVFVGITVLIFFYLIGRKNYKLLGAFFTLLLAVVVFSTSFHDIFFDVVDPLVGNNQNFDEMGSGRLGGWSSMLDEFFSSSIIDQIRGLGISAQMTITSGAYFGGAHNDFLSIFLCFGYIGAFIYLLLYAFFILSVLLSKVDREYKFIMLGFIFSVAIMNFLSNSYLTRFELAQYFYFIYGAFLNYNDNLS